MNGLLETNLSVCSSNVSCKVHCKKNVSVFVYFMLRSVLIDAQTSGHRHHHHRLTCRSNLTFIECCNASLHYMFSRHVNAPKFLFLGEERKGTNQMTVLIIPNIFFCVWWRMVIMRQTVKTDHHHSMMDDESCFTFVVIWMVVHSRRHYYM